MVIPSKDQVPQALSAKLTRVSSGGMHRIASWRNQATLVDGHSSGEPAAVHRRSSRNDQKQKGRAHPDHSGAGRSAAAKDLTACGIPVQDARGFRVDFHALRHTEAQSLPLFSEMEKFGASLPSSIASLKFGKTGQNLSKLDPTDDAEGENEIIPIDSQSTQLGKAVPSRESVPMVLHCFCYDMASKW